MASGFCPSCGSEVFREDQTLCDACYVEDIDPVDYPDSVELRVCSRCGSYVEEKEGGGKSDNWTSEDENVPESELVIRKVQSSLKAHLEVEDIRVSVSPEQVDSNIYRIGCVFEGVMRGFVVRDEFTVDVTVSRETCPTCSKMAGGYYEGVVQIRARNRHPTENETETAREIAYDIAGKDYEDRDTFVSKIEELDEGIDIYMSTNKSGRDLARKMVEEFGGSFSDSATLVGEKQGEELYRVTYSVRLPEFTEGDIVSVDGDPILVTGNHEILKGLNLQTGETHTEGSPQESEMEKIGDRKDSYSTTLVSDQGDEIQVLNPETYETVTLQKPLFVTQSEGEDVEAVNTREGLVVLPRD